MLSRRLVVRRIHPKAERVLLFGFVGLFLIPLFAPYTLLLGTRTLRDIRGRPERYSGTPKVVIGMAMASIVVGLWALIAGAGVVVLLTE